MFSQAGAALDMHRKFLNVARLASPPGGVPVQRWKPNLVSAVIVRPIPRPPAPIAVSSRARLTRSLACKRTGRPSNAPALARWLRARNAVVTRSCRLSST